MLYMLDTDISSYIMRRRPRAVLEALEERAAARARLVISSITYAELRLGARRSAATQKHQTLIDAYCQRLAQVLPWDAAAADAFADLQANLLTVGTPIGVNDAMIAGHALASGAVLVSNNQRHFARVPGLKLENWASDG